MDHHKPLISITYLAVMRLIFHEGKFGQNPGQIVGINQPFGPLILVAESDADQFAVWVNHWPAGKARPGIADENEIRRGGITRHHHNLAHYAMGQTQLAAEVLAVCSDCFTHDRGGGGRRWSAVRMKKQKIRLGSDRYHSFGIQQIGVMGVGDGDTRLDHHGCGCRRIEPEMDATRKRQIGRGNCGL